MSAYSTISLTSLIPCSIMAIGASNLFANNINRDFINPKVKPAKLKMITRSIVFVVIGLALIFGMVFPTALVSLQLLGGMVQIFPAIVFSLFWRTQTIEATIIGLIVGLIVTAAVYTTGNTIGIYEGFWGLLANVLVLVILNPEFVKNTKYKSNPIIDQLFSTQQSTEIKKGA